MLDDFSCKHSDAGELQEVSDFCGLPPKLSCCSYLLPRIRSCHSNSIIICSVLSQLPFLPSGRQQSSAYVLIVSPLWSLDMQEHTSGLEILDTYRLHGTLHRNRVTE